MEGEEIERFIKVWMTAISCICYCYLVASRFPKGFMRLFSILPIIFIFLALPLNLSSFHLGAPTTFLLVWLSPFKLLLFSFNHGPLYSQPPIHMFHFISIASLPIKIKNNQVPKHTTRIAQSILLVIKLVALATIIRIYEYRENLNPYLILGLYCCHMYIGLEIMLAIFAAPARAIFGFEIEAQFNEPYLSTSLQDFWGRRWNLMVTSILRPTIYDPIRHVSRRILGPVWGPMPATIATFLVSGLMHELIYYYLSRAHPTWEVTCYFVLHGLCMAIEVVVKKALVPRGWRLHPAVSGPLTVLFLAVTGKWLFFPQLLRNGVDTRAIREYGIMVDFVRKLSSTG